jgi:aminopeptidase S
MRVIGLVCTAVAAAVLVGCSAPAAVTAPSSVAGDGAYAHLTQLQRITDAAGGTRTTPSPGYDAAVDHVAAVLRAAGWDVSTPSYEVEGVTGAGYRNVIAQTRTGDPGHVVMAGAHLDSVPEGPGINDNGSGVAALLQIADQLGGSPGLPGTVRGRDHGSGDDEAGPAGSAQVARVLTEELARVGATAEGDVFDGLSDYDPFIQAGIPTGGVFSGDDTEKTDAQAEAWGGQAGEEFDPCYHDACDRLDDIDRVALGRFTDAVDASLRRFAASTAALV